MSRNSGAALWTALCVQFVGTLLLSRVDAALGSQTYVASHDSVTQQCHFVSKGSPEAVAVSPDGRFVVVGGEVAHVWKPRAGREVATLDDENGYITETAFSPDGRWLVTGSYDEDGGPGAVTLWNVHTWDRAATLVKGHGIGAIAMSPDGKFVAAASASDYGKNYVWVWSMATRKRIMRRIGYASRLDFSPDGRSIAIAEKQGIRVIDVHSGRSRHRIGLTLKSEQAQLVDAVWFSNPKSLTIVSGNRLTPYDVSTGRWRAAITIPGAVSAMCRVPGRSEVALSSNDRRVTHGVKEASTISVWDIKTGRCFGHIAAPHAATLAASGNGLTLVVAQARDADDRNGQTIITVLRIHRP